MREMAVMSATELAGMFVLLICGLILWQSDQITEGRETSYIMAQPLSSSRRTSRLRACCTCSTLSMTTRLGYQSAATWRERRRNR
jgi:hypothetical protein